MLSGIFFLNIIMSEKSLSLPKKIEMSKVAAYYHIVISTKNREMTIPPQYREDLYRFIWKTISNYKCTLIRIGGIQNHIHILLDLNPTVALSKLVQEIKALSSGWMTQDSRFPQFYGWSPGYYAYTISPNIKHYVIEYIKNQEAHHLGRPFDDEIISLYQESGFMPDQRDMR